MKTYINTIWFDMDGTLADCYGCPNYAEYFDEGSTYPYEQAETLVEKQAFSKVINKLQQKGIKIGIISWTARNADKDYCKRTKKVKKNWLKENFPTIEWDSIHIVKYGTNKNKFNEKGKTNILFDDEEINRKNWKGFSFNEKNILSTLNLIK